MDIILDRIQELMGAEGVKSLTQLEKACDLTPRTIHKWRTNTPSIDKVVKVARYFDVSVDYLVGLTDIKKPAENFTRQELDLLDFIRNDPELRAFALHLQSQRTLAPSQHQSTNETK